MLHWLTSLFKPQLQIAPEPSVPAEIQALRRMGNRGRQETFAMGRMAENSASNVRPAGVIHDDFHSGRTDGEWGTILTRATDGRPLTFDYAKRHGEQSSRALFDWVEFPQHVQGICSEKGVVLSFRKDRVSAWNGGCAAMLKAPKGKSRR